MPARGDAPSAPPAPTPRELWTSEFREELHRLRPHLDEHSKIAHAIAGQQYAAASLLKPKVAAQRWHAKNGGGPASKF